jgi:hypothetical protein
MRGSFDRKLHRDVVEAYRALARRTGNTTAAFGAALAVLEQARPGMIGEEARRAVAAMLALEPEDDAIR